MALFEVQMKYLTEAEGKVKKHTDRLLIETETFGNAEEIGFDQMGKNERDVTCHAVTRSNVNEILRLGSGEKWYKIAYTMIISDDEGKEKAAKFVLLLDADDTTEASRIAHEHLGLDATINDVKDAKFADVIEYEKKAEGTRTEAQQRADELEESKLSPVTSRAYPNLQPVFDPKRGIEAFKNKAMQDEKELDAAMQKTHSSGADLIYGAEFTIDCAMEDQAVSTTRPLKGIADLLISLGFGHLKIKQIQRITEQADALPLKEFQSWAYTAHDIGAPSAVIIWEGLK